MTKRSAKADARRPAGGALFLSYNTSDREAIFAIRDALQKRAVTTFFDRHDLTVGLPWVKGLEDALRKASAVAVFIGSGGIGRWQQREMHFAMDRQAHEEESGRVFPVIAVMLPQSDASAAPAFLLLNTWIDLHDRLDDAAALDLLAESVRGRSPASRKQSVVLCPYRALQAFREEDAPLFFGREALAAQLQQKISDRKLILVVGPSGSGKSSVVQAGLLPLLRKHRAPTWDAVTFTLSNRPFHRMAAALVGIWGMEKSISDRLLEAEQLGERLRTGAISARGAVDMALAKSSGTDRLLMVIDQFEELFTLTNESDRRAFVDGLLEAAEPNPVKIVLTLRADFFSQAIGLSRQLSDAIQEGLINIGPMTREELRRAVEKPAAAVGLQFEQGLVDRIVDHVERQPGNLPLLEFALTELFGDATNRIFTHAAYNEIGGVEGAVAKRAEVVFAALEEEEQKTAIRSLTRLVRVTSANEEGSDTRQRIMRGELDPAAEAVFRPFVQARLLVVGRNETTQDQTIEVAHEALIRNWKRLGDSVNKNRDFLLWRQRLGLLLSEWERSGKERALVLRGALLTEAEKWLKDREQDDRERDLSERERAFIQASLREEAEASRLPSWVAAMEMTDPLSKTLALEDVVETLAGSDLEQAKLAAREALDAARKIPEEERSRGLYSAVNALIKAQEAPSALGVARTISDSDDRSAALTRVAQYMVGAGHADDALRVAHEIEHPLDVGKLAKDLARDGRSQEILQVAKSMADSDKRLRAQTSVVEAMAIAGRIDEALGAACETCDPYTFGRLAAPLADAGRLVDLLHAAGALPNLDARRRSFRGIAAELVRFGRLDALKTAALSIGDSIDYSLIHAGIAEAQARAGQHKEAIEITKMIGSLDLQSETLQLLADIIARDGKTRDAVALALLIPPQKQRGAFGWIADSLLKQGKKVELLNAIKDLPDDLVRSRALAGAARTFAQIGDIDQALALAKDAGDPYLMLDLAYSPAAIGKLLKILDAAGTFPSAADQRAAFRCVAEALLHAGKIEVLLDAARQISDKGKQSLALAEIACAVAKNGEVEQAKAVIRGIPDSEARSDAAARTAAEFVTLGKIGEAVDAARDVCDPMALSKVAQLLAQAGRIDESLQVAAGFSDPFALAALSKRLVASDKSIELLSLAGAFRSAQNRRIAFRELAKEFLRFGKLDALIHSAAGMPDPKLRTVALKQMAIEVATSANCVDALAIAQKIPIPGEQVSTFSTLADLAAQNGRIEDAVAAAQRIQFAPVQRDAFVRIAEALINLELSEPLLQALAGITDAAIRSYGLAGMIQALCDVNRHVEAIVLAATIPDEAEQATAYLHCAAACARLANLNELGTSLLEISDTNDRSQAQRQLMAAMLRLGEKDKAILLSATVADPATRFELIGWTLTQAGYLSDALQTALEIQLPDDRSRAISGILEAYLNIGEANRVLSSARTIDDSEKRSLVLHEIATALRKFGSRATAVAKQLEGEPGAQPKRKAGHRPKH